MPLTLKKQRYHPGDPVVFESVLWFMESELDDSPTHTMDFYRVVVVVSLGTMTGVDSYPHKLWYDVEYDVGSGGCLKSQHFLGPFHKEKGPDMRPAMREPLGVVCGRLNLDDKYEVYQYLRQVARTISVSSEYKITYATKPEEASAW